MLVYALLFVEGIITFISPCMLPMLPLYLSYFSAGESNLRRTLRNACGFVLGFTLVFVLLGAFAGQMGRLLVRYRAVLDIVTGAVVVAFGLSYLGVFRLLPFFRGLRVEMGAQRLKSLGFFSALLFGLVFAVGWTPCVGVFLGAALMLAAASGHQGQGILMLFIFSMGLGLPFLLAAVVIDRLKTATDFVKRHYRVINLVSGAFLILMGILIMTGWVGILAAKLM